MSTFKGKLDQEGLDFFDACCQKPFDQQAVDFLNAYWDEVGSQADFIFEAAFEVIKYADMHEKGVHYVHLYNMGNLLDFNIGLYFYEQLCKFCNDPKNSKWTTDEYKMSQPEMMTAIARKKELKEKVDVNFDGKITFLEYLLYQYREMCNPVEFVNRSMKAPDEHPEVKKARLALEAVNERIRAYEEEKARLMRLAYELDGEGNPILVDGEPKKKSGVKALGAVNQLAQLAASPTAEALNKALITAEAAVRKAVRMFGAGGTHVGAGAEAQRSDGAIYWMQKDLAVKKQRYGRRS